MKQGYILPHANGMRIRPFEESESTATFIAKKDGHVVAVLSLVTDSREHGLPSDLSFKAELDEMRSQGLFISELTNQVVDEPYRRSAITTELMRCAIAHGLQAKHDRGVAAISASHVDFYEIMGFSVFGAERSYSNLVYDPVVAVCITQERYLNPTSALSEIEQFVQQFMIVENPYMDRVIAWDAAARAAFQPLAD